MKQSRTAKVAKIVAIAAAPIGLLLGMMLAVGQDLAGAGMIRGLMFFAGLAVAIIALLVYLLASVNWRMPRIPWSTLRRNGVKIAITAALFIGLISALVLIGEPTP